jgi:hypothetical protein
MIVGNLDLHLVLGSTSLGVKESMATWENGVNLKNLICFPANARNSEAVHQPSRLMEERILSQAHHLQVHPRIEC